MHFIFPNTIITREVPNGVQSTKYHKVKFQGHTLLLYNENIKLCPTQVKFQTERKRTTVHAYETNIGLHDTHL